MTLRLWVGALALLTACSGTSAPSPRLGAARPSVSTGAKCQYRQQGRDPLQVLPDASCTPGDTDPNVTQVNIHQTICDPHWQDSRPPSSVTAKIKKQALADYGRPQSDSRLTELDHLIPVRDGGASDAKNLWPEPNYTTKQSSPYVHNPKDVVELRVYTAVCRAKNPVKLRDAQRAMATDWTTALKVLGLEQRTQPDKPHPSPTRS